MQWVVRFDGPLVHEQRVGVLVSADLARASDGVTDAIGENGKALYQVVGIELDDAAAGKGRVTLKDELRAAICRKYLRGVILKFALDVDPEDGLPGTPLNRA